MRRQINVPTWAVLGLWILAIAAGTGLRLWNLSDQVVGGDEMHGVRAAVKGQLVDILRTYQQADPCIPLAGYYHLAMDAWGSLSEAVVRAPALAAGLLVLLVIPWLVRSRLGDAGALLLAWLLALSPLLVLYSRLARPYMPVVLVGFVSFLAFDRWAEGEGARWGGLWALCAALAIWLHLVSAPFVLAPWLFEAVRKGLSGRRRRAPAVGKRLKGALAPLRWRGLLAGGALAAGLLAVMIGPALPSLQEVLASKKGASEIGVPALRGVALLMAGSGYGVWAVLFWLLAVVGAVRLWRRRSLFLARGLSAVAALAVALWLLAPWGVSNPLVLNRYGLVAYPLVLCCVVSAFGLGATASSRRLALPVAPVLVGAGLVLAALWAGPLPAASYRLSSFTQSNDYVGFHEPLPPPPPLPPALAALAEPGPLLVFPWPSRWRMSRVQAALQREHRRSVVVSSPERPLNLEPIRFRNLSAASPQAFLASRARYLVVFRNVANEDRLLAPPAPATIFLPAQERRYRKQAQQMAQRLRDEWGAPLAEDARVLIWDLDQQRALRHIP